VPIAAASVAAALMQVAASEAEQARSPAVPSDQL
jgi:hypothetical protein